MDLSITTTALGGATTHPFVSEHGLDQPSHTVTIDAANLAAGDIDGDAFPGVLPAGFPLAIITADGTYAKYDDGNSDGTEVLRGVLRHDVPFDSATDIRLGVMVTHATVSAALLPETIDAAGLADLPTLSVVA